MNNQVRTSHHITAKTTSSSIKDVLIYYWPTEGKLPFIPHSSCQCKAGVQVQMLPGCCLLNPLQQKFCAAPWRQDTNICWGFQLCQNKALINEWHIQNVILWTVVKQNTCLRILSLIFAFFNCVACNNKQKSNDYILTFCSLAEGLKSFRKSDIGIHMCSTRAHSMPGPASGWMATSSEWSPFVLPFGSHVETTCCCAMGNTSV